MTPLGQRYDCPECGYQGSFVVEADSLEDAKRIREELQADLEEPEAGEADGDEESD